MYNTEFTDTYCRYLDRYREKEDVEKEILEERLKNLDPFKPEEPRPEYPNLLWNDGWSKREEWRRAEEIKKNYGTGKYRGLYRNTLM